MMHVLLITAFFGCSFAYESVNFVKNASDEREPKFFGLGFGVGIVRFENKYCSTPEGLDGTCYTRRQCNELGGTMSGNCAGTIGRCCTIQRGCGVTSSYNNTYFVNTNFPALVTGSTSCTYVIRKCNPGICQVRIDFLSLTLATPDANGYCVYDSLRITGGASFVTPICGENSGQHIYLGFNGADDITISITTTSARSIPRSWYIKVAQIDCECPTKAPDGCLMYYTGLTGTVKSFNYGSTQTSETYPFPGITPPQLPGTREMANLNYGVCIQMHPGYCSIRWTANGMFAVSNSTPGMTNVTMGCFNDWVLIPNPNPIGGGMTPDRFCGNWFPPSVTSSSKPFVLYVVTDNTENHSMNITNLNEIGNLGFSLSYEQIPCNPLSSLQQLL